MEGATRAVEPIVRLDLNDEVYWRVKEQLVSRHFESEERLSLQSLAEALGVSRSPVHQALTRLASEGLVTARPRRGYYVTPLTADKIDEAYEVRLALELRAAEHAVGRLTPDQLAELHRLADAAVPTGSDADAKERYIAANIEFHEYIIELGGNALMLDLYRQLSINMMMRRIMTGRSLDIGELTEEHARILDAFDAGDLAAAREALRAHVESGKRIAAAAIADAGGAV